MLVGVEAVAEATALLALVVLGAVEQEGHFQALVMESLEQPIPVVVAAEQAEILVVLTLERAVLAAPA